MLWIDAGEYFDPGANQPSGPCSRVFSGTVPDRGSRVAPIMVSHEDDASRLLQGNTGEACFISCFLLGGNILTLFGQVRRALWELGFASVLISHIGCRVV
jgi:hypothetical protein